MISTQWQNGQSKLTLFLKYVKQNLCQLQPTKCLHMQHKLND